VIKLTKTPSPLAFGKWDWVRCDPSSLHLKSTSPIPVIFNDLIDEISRQVDENVPHGDNALVVLSDFAEVATVELARVGAIELRAFGDSEEIDGAGDPEVVMSFDLADAVTLYMETSPSNKNEWAEFLRELADRIDGGIE